MFFDPKTISFSRRGSYLAFNELAAAQHDTTGAESELCLRTLHGFNRSPDRRVFRFTPQLDGKSVKPTIQQTASLLTLAAEGGRQIDFVFASPSVVRIRGKGLGLCLNAPVGNYNFARPAGPGCWEFNLANQNLQIMLRLRHGRGELDAPWKETSTLRLNMQVEPDETGTWELELHEFVAGWKPTHDARDFDACVQEVDAEFAAWRDGLPSVPAHHAQTRDLAAYVMWSCLVAPCGHLRRETMYMSNKGMPAVWAWDHCFNALALASGHPALAWDQWAVIFDFQTRAGSLPDVASDTDFIVNFVKPPIHGWALRELCRHVQLTPAQKRQALRWLERWTNWWLDYRDDDHDGIPQYNHGNDSGWDNATVFAHGMPVEAPDLCVFLILQMDECAALAEELGRPASARRWRQRADNLLARLLKHSWQDGRFIAPRSGDHSVADESNSLIPFMPLLLGKRLPSDIRCILLDGLKQPGRFITSYGLATESPTSALYQSDGYWRGPVWAPSTLLIASGLRACGENALAADIGQRFCRACEQSGMAENFDAVTGQGLREPAHTWTASGFLVLASEYLISASEG